MSDEKKHSFWITLPGILTGIASIITAVAGLYVVLSDGDDQRPQQGTSTEITRKADQSEVSKTQPEKQQEVQTDKKPGKGNASSIAVNEESRINLFASENGGQVLLGTSKNWLSTIDGKEYQDGFVESIIPEAVFAFKNKQLATFDTFAVLVLDSQDYNLAEFELLAGNDSPTSKFQSIGRFKTLNAKLFEDPYQKFKFDPVTAKYLKVRLLSNHEGPHWAGAVLNVREFQLWGNLK